MYVFAIYIKEKNRLKNKHFFYLRLVLINQVVARILTSFGFRFKNISDRLLEFGAKILPQKIYFLLKYI